MSFSRNVRYLYLQIFFHSLIFAYVIERLFALERGITVQMVVYCEIIYSAVTVALELPSGVLADRFGRKALLVFGAAFTVLEFLVLPFAHGFLLFGVSAFVAAVGGASTSGAWNALLYDSLRADGRAGEFEKILGRVRAVDFTASLLAGLLGAMLARHNGYAFVYWLSVASTSVALVAACALREPPKSSAAEETEPGLRAITGIALRFFREQPDVFRIVLQAAIIASCVNYVDEFWQNYLNDIAFPLALFGVVSALGSLVRTPGGLLAPWLLRRVGHRAALRLSSALAACGTLWAALAQSAWGIAGMAVAYFAVELMGPVSAGYVHHRAAPAARATIESAGSMLQRGIATGVGLLFGFVTDRFNIFAGFWLVGGIAAVTSVIFFNRVTKRTS